jgi:hypothetical protein
MLSKILFKKFAVKKYSWVECYYHVKIIPHYESALIIMKVRGRHQRSYCAFIIVTFPKSIRQLIHLWNETKSLYTAEHFIQKYVKHRTDK